MPPPLSKEELVAEMVFRVGPLLEVESLSEWIGEPITDPLDVKRAERTLAYALTLINIEIDRDDTYWREHGLPEAVSQVALQLAGRGYMNPESWGNEGVDDWRAGGRPIEELGMYLTPTEKRTIAKFAPSRLFGIGVVDTYRETTPQAVSPWSDPVTGGINDWRHP